jgi:HAD superfamily hydrolase (TIGR01509 family)
VIFDCDGVLIDSELLANQAEVEALNAIGASFTREAYMARFMGLSDGAARALLADEFGLAPPEPFWQRVQARCYCLFARDLRAIPGIEPLLSALRLPACVASSSSPERLYFTLGLTDLLRFFPERVFSSQQVQRGKPHPDLFHYAATQLGVVPAACLVVEDSPLGVQAAHAAGMRVIGFAGGSHMTAAVRSRLRAACPEAIVQNAAALARMLE